MASQMIAIGCSICNDTSTNQVYCDQCSQLLRWFRGYLDMPNTSVVTGSTTFLDLGVDSLDYMCWLHEAKEHFNIDIPDQDSQQMRTVGDYLRFLRSKGAKWHPQKSIRLVKSGHLCTHYSWTVVDGTINRIE